MWYNVHLCFADEDRALVIFKTNMGEINGNNGKGRLLENKDTEWYLSPDELSTFQKDFESSIFLKVGILKRIRMAILLLLILNKRSSLNFLDNKLHFMSLILKGNLWGKDQEAVLWFSGLFPQASLPPSSLPS